MPCSTEEKYFTNTYYATMSSPRIGTKENLEYKIEVTSSCKQGSCLKQSFTPIFKGQGSFYSKEESTSYDLIFKHASHKFTDIHCYSSYAQWYTSHK